MKAAIAPTKLTSYLNIGELRELNAQAWAGEKGKN